MRVFSLVVGLMAFGGQAWAQDPAAAPEAMPAAAPAAAPAAPAAQVSEAAAGTGGIRLGIQANGSKVTGDQADAFNMGFGFGVRGGYELRFGGVSLTPELEVLWTRWATADALSTQGVDAGWVLGIMPGARVGYAVGPALPWFAFHVGLDHADSSGSAMAEATNKLGIDFGAGADFALGAVGLGPFVSYNIDFTENTSISWLSFGLAGTFNL